MRTPLAWKNLTASWSKCGLAAAGVGFAVVLMFMQIGFRNALIDSNVQVFSLFDLGTANVAVLSRSRYNIATEQRFHRSWLEKVTAAPEVVRQGTVSLERGTAQVQVAGRPARPIRVIAVDDGALGFLADRGLADQLQAADRQQACLLDRESKPTYGFAATVDLLRQQHIELNHQRLAVDGFFRLGTDFGNDGSLLMTERLHSGYFPWRSPSRQPRDLIDVALLQVQPAAGDSLANAVHRLRQIASDRLDVRPSTEFVDREKQFWARATPIGKIFMIGTVMGLIVGAIICYQIQFTDINDHMAEFATLKAMGYSPGYFWRLVLSQSVYLSCLGFLPGWLAAYFLYQSLARYSGLIMELTWDRILLVWCLTLAMCLVSGGLAFRKLFASDPANLF